VLVLALSIYYYVYVVVPFYAHMYDPFVRLSNHIDMQMSFLFIIF